MAGDEPRRSGRATKGQHRADQEESESNATQSTPAPTKKGGKKGKKGSKKQEVEEEEEEPAAIIRCICGYVEEDPDDTRAMICCDKCSAWQHNVCMGLPEDEDELPEQYFCEQCKPQDHQETVVAIKRGERIWETRQIEHERQKEEQKRGKKGGKKGRKSKGGRASEAAELGNDSQSEQPSSQTIPSTTFYAKPEPGQKRKIDDAEEDEEDNAIKTRRVGTTRDTKPPRRQSSKHVELQTELVEKIEDLHNNVRQRAAKAFVKLFEDLATKANTEGKFKLPKGQTKESFALSLGLSVEFCLYINLWGHGSDPSPPYSEKLRVILYNVKANPDLRDNLLNQKLTPNALTEMTSDEMASKEVQAQNAKLAKETEKQHILMPASAPKYRKTHKGDELIEDSSHYVNSESAPQLSTRVEEEETKEQSPERDGSHSPTAYQAPVAKSKPLSVDTQARRRSTIDRKSSSGMDNVWSAIDSPSATRPVATPSTPGLRGPGTKADAEIDELLGNDDDEAPYSPTEQPLEPGMIWRGSLVMPTVAEFKGSARYAAGANLEQRHPWNNLIGNRLWIEGRITAETASSYVCNLRYSKTTDVSVISLTPNDNPTDQAGFTKLFDYFTTRGRWGVGKSPLENTRDVYVIPLESGSAPKPVFLDMLEENVVSNDRPERQLLVVYIIKLTGSLPSQTGTPSTPASQPLPVSESERTGRAAADYILGPQFSSAPTVNFILTQAPNCGETQFVHVKECYLEDPRTITDWNLLVNALTARAEKREAAEMAAAAATAV